MSDNSEPLIHHCILGGNTTIQPRKPATPTSRRKANLSEVSTYSAESDNECRCPGFIFSSFGELEYAMHLEGKNSSSALAETIAATVEDDDLGWTATGFNSVARLGEFGSINGVYAIYNMVYFDETTGHDKVITYGSWGIPPG